MQLRNIRSSSPKVVNDIASPGVLHHRLARSPVHAHPPRARGPDCFCL